MKYDYDVLIVGNGAAGYAAADRLYGKNVKNICIVTENAALSTSRCSGSDKQTYYKLDVASPEGDSVRKMAEDLFAGGSMDGRDALLEAAYSLPCFMHLVELGVPFPKDDFGIYQGYRTDHDNTKRATSCGPLTSKYMTEQLEKKVLSDGTELLDGYKAVRLAVKDGRCCGAYCLTDGKIKLITAENTVLCTGAPSAVYADSVFPAGHTGATGLAIEAGAALSNFQEWQYGIASTDFRWNLSGSYQQVIPCYISVDGDGNEYEFLSEKEDIFTKIFLKGYEWPFSSEKTDGSSLIDICIMNEISIGRKIYLDYTRNPSGFDVTLLGDEAVSYLENAGVSGDTPFERLESLNPKAVKLFLDHGIDLSCERLRIGVCAQHNNGGIKVDIHGETTVKNLFCAGEASGRFGVCRPGGAALNDTQAGSALIAEYISRTLPCGGDCPEFPEMTLPSLHTCSNVSSLDSYFARQMSDFAGAVRYEHELGNIISGLRKLLDDFGDRVKISSEKQYAEYFTFYHTTLARLALCMTELTSASVCGSRGGCICLDGSGAIIPENKKYRGYITVTRSGAVSFEGAAAIPGYTCAFENLLKG